MSIQKQIPLVIVLALLGIAICAGEENKARPDISPAEISLAEGFFRALQSGDEMGYKSLFVREEDYAKRPHELDEEYMARSDNYAFYCADFRVLRHQDIHISWDSASMGTPHKGPNGEIVIEFIHGADLTMRSELHIGATTKIGGDLRILRRSATPYIASGSSNFLKPGKSSDTESKTHNEPTRQTNKDGRANLPNKMK